MQNDFSSYDQHHFHDILSEEIQSLIDNKDNEAALKLGKRTTELEEIAHFNLATINKKSPHIIETRIKIALQTAQAAKNLGDNFNDDLQKAAQRVEDLLQTTMENYNYRFVKINDLHSEVARCEDDGHIKLLNDTVKNSAGIITISNETARKIEATNIINSGLEDIKTREKDAKLVKNPSAKEYLEKKKNFLIQLYMHMFSGYSLSPEQKDVLKNEDNTPQ